MQATGRPATGHDPVLALRLPKEVTKRIDHWCVGTGMSRSEAIRLMVECGLMTDHTALQSQRRGGLAISG